MDIHVGNRLRTRRTMLGLNQRKLGEKVGVTYQQIQKYERGIDRISASKLFIFAKELHVPTDYFFEEYEEVDTSMQRELAKLNKAFIQIPDKKIRKDIINIIRDFSEDI